MENVDKNKFFLNWRKIGLWKNTPNKRSRIHKRVIIFHIKSIPDTRDDKLPRFGSIPSTVAPIKKPEIKETIENTKTSFYFLLHFI